jgi:CRISPR-associated protein Cas2
MSHSDPHNYIIAYDIVDDQRRERIAKRLQAHGDRMQYSVFWVRTSPAKLVRLQSSFKALISQADDSVLICDLGSARASAPTRITVLGRSRSLTGDGALIV